MKRSVMEQEFVDDMATEDNGFSRMGAGALYDYLQELEEDIGEEIEYDPVAFRGEYAEYDTIEEAANEYAMTPEELEENTTVIEVPESRHVIVQTF